MNIFIMFGMGIIFIVGPLLAIYHYKTLSDLPKKPKKETLPKDAKVFRPPKWRFILIEAAIIGVGIAIVTSLMISFYPPKYASPYRFVIVYVIIHILFRLFLPLHKVDDLMLIISCEEVISTLLSKRITFPVSEIDQKIGQTLPNETNKWIIYRYMKAMQRKIEQWLGNEYIYSVDGKRIELSPFHFKREQINEILNEVESVIKAFATHQEDQIEADETR